MAWAAAQTYSGGGGGASEALVRAYGVRFRSIAGLDHIRGMYGQLHADGRPASNHLALVQHVANIIGVGVGHEEYVARACGVRLRVGVKDGGGVSLGLGVGNAGRLVQACGGELISEELWSKSKHQSMQGAGGAAIVRLLRNYLEAVRELHKIFHVDTFEEMLEEYQFMLRRGRRVAELMVALFGEAALVISVRHVVNHSPSDAYILICAGTTFRWASEANLEHLHHDGRNISIRGPLYGGGGREAERALKVLKDELIGLEVLRKLREGTTNLAALARQKRALKRAMERARKRQATVEPADATMTPADATMTPADDAPADADAAPVDEEDAPADEEGDVERAPEEEPTIYDGRGDELPPEDEPDDLEEPEETDDEDDEDDVVQLETRGLKSVDAALFSIILSKARGDQSFQTGSTLKLSMVTSYHLRQVKFVLEPTADGAKASAIVKWTSVYSFKKSEAPRPSNHTKLELEIVGKPATTAHEAGSQKTFADTFHSAFAVTIVGLSADLDPLWDQVCQCSYHVHLREGRVWATHDQTGALRERPATAPKIQTAETERVQNYFRAEASKWGKLPPVVQLSIDVICARVGVIEARYKRTLSTPEFYECPTCGRRVEFALNGDARTDDGRLHWRCESGRHAEPEQAAATAVASDALWNDEADRELIDAVERMEAAVPAAGPGATKVQQIASALTYDPGPALLAVMSNFEATDAKKTAVVKRWKALTTRLDHAQRTNPIVEGRLRRFREARAPRPTTGA